MNPHIEFTRICQDVLAEGNKLKFQVSGGSMRPFLRSGDTVVVEPAGISVINSGDIVFCKTNTGKLCVHRVMKKLNQNEQPVLVTKGDAWIHPDPLVEESNVLGKVIAIERNGKYKGVDSSAHYFWLGLARIGPYFYPLAAKLKKMHNPARIYEELLVKISNGQTENNNLMEKMSKPGFKWDYFWQRAIEEKVAPLIYKSLETWGTERLNIPAEVLGQFRSSYYQTLANNVLIFKKTGEILAAFHRQGIKVLIFKGPVLAQLLYPDIAQRPMTDIDILVAPGDLAAADSILQGLHYAAPFAIKDFSSLKTNSYRNSLMYSDPQGTPRFIHLYWHLLNLSPYDQEVLEKFTMRNIWQTATTVNVDEAPGLTLSDTHQVIYLCLHGFQHAYTPGILLYDLHKLLRLKGNSLNWDHLVADSFTLGLNKYVYFGLYLAHEVFGTQVPQDYLAKLKPRKLSIFERRFLQGFVRHGFYGRHVDLKLVSLGMNETWGKRLEFISRSLFPGTQEMALISQQEQSKITFRDYIRRALGEKLYRTRDLRGKLLGRDIIIRAAELADKEALKKVYPTMTIPEIEQLLIGFKGKGFWLAAFKKRMIVGALTVTQYEKNEQLWLIFGMETRLLFRGVGIAKKLVREAIERAAAAGASEVGLFVNKKSIPALNLYRQAGFSEFSAPYQRSNDEIYLQYSCPNQE